MVSNTLLRWEVTGQGQKNDCDLLLLSSKLDYKASNKSNASMLAEVNCSIKKLLSSYWIKLKTEHSELVPFLLENCCDTYYAEAADILIKELVGWNGESYEELRLSAYYGFTGFYLSKCANQSDFTSVAKKTTILELAKLDERMGTTVAELIFSCCRWFPQKEALECLIELGKQTEAEEEISKSIFAFQGLDNSSCLAALFQHATEMQQHIQCSPDDSMLYVIEKSTLFLVDLARANNISWEKILHQPKPVIDFVNEIKLHHDEQINQKLAKSLLSDGFKSKTPHRSRSVYSIESMPDDPSSLESFSSASGSEIYDGDYIENAESRFTTGQKLERIEPKIDVDTCFLDVETSTRTENRLRCRIIERDEFSEEVLESIGQKTLHNSEPSFVKPHQEKQINQKFTKFALSDNVESKTCPGNRPVNSIESMSDDASSIGSFSSGSGSEIYDGEYTENAEIRFTTGQKLESIEPKIDVDTHYLDIRTNKRTKSRLNGRIVERDEFSGEVLESVGTRHFNSSDDIIWVRYSNNVNFAMLLSERKKMFPDTIGNKWRS